MNEKWDKRFLDLAAEVAKWSKDPSTKVGAVLVDSNRIVVGLGYNGFARGVEDAEDRLNTREIKYKMVVHAEVNAILQAGDKARGATLYVTPPFLLPNICHDCCKFAIQAGVKEVVSFNPPEENERLDRWKESLDLARTMCTEAGMGWRGVSKE